MQQEYHHQETPAITSSSSPLITDASADHVQQLQMWLALPTAREQRRFLEQHIDLLSEHCETILSTLFAQEPEGLTQGKENQQREARLLLQDARRRGGNVGAVREAYINLYGGFVLDVPSWLEEVEQRLNELLRQNRPEETAEARIALLQEVLERDREETPYAPELLATMRQELADAWRSHPRTNRGQALEAAISCCGEVLPILTVTRYPYQYAKTQRILGVMYLDRITGERRDNLERAIACYQEALRIYTLDTFPFNYARVQDNLGIAYRNRITGEQRDNLERAIACYQKALHVYTLDAFPFEYAGTQSNLGVAYRNRVVGERRDNLERAIACYQETLRICTLDASPFNYARVQDNLGVAYRYRVVGERRDNLERAITHYQEALHIYTLDAFPFEYARTQNDLGTTYRNRIAGERCKNLERAIACYQEALHIHTLDASPFNYARVQDNLGTAYRHRIAGEHYENLERAIACYQEALHIYTLDAFPLEYVQVQNDLGSTYRDCIVGEQRENVERAITCFYETFRVYTLEAFPREFRSVQVSIAEAEAQRENWNAAQNAYTAALHTEDLLVILGAGTLGRDAILKEGGDAAIRLGYVLHRLGATSEAAVALERGRARGLAEALTFDAADPALITDEQRRARYIHARAALIAAQADLHTPLSHDLDENARRRLDLERTASYRQAKADFDAQVMEIRAANDPAEFLSASLDATTILQAAQRIGPGHALVYLVATPWGGVAVAALGEQRSSSPQFATLDLPDLTEAFVITLIETYLSDSSKRLIGGFALAQMGEGFAQFCQQWEGETFEVKAKALHAEVTDTQQQSTLDQAIQTALACPPFAALAEHPLALLDDAQHNLVAVTFDAFFLQHELTRCLELLGTSIMHPLASWLSEQGVTSLTLIPCGHLATFPLASVMLPNGRAVSETLPTSVAPSARSLLHPAAARATQAGVYALGDPQRNLHWSEAEALTLTALARRFALPAEAHVKGQATRERLLSALGTRWMVDASCHGVFDREDFLQSALLLANKGHLSMAEMLTHQVDLRGLRLLLLSACQTAQVDLHGARNEVHSLAAAMLQAGAQAVLASQWPVDDKATYLLMVRFAQEWFPHMLQEPPATALARAQAWLRRVTNQELALWHRTMPTPAGMKPLLKTGSKRRLAEQGSMGNTPTQWKRIPVRGRSARHNVDDAQLAVRLGAENEEPSTQPYADPYYWAGFQVIGW